MKSALEWTKIVKKHSWH